MRRTARLRTRVRLAGLSVSLSASGPITGPITSLCTIGGTVFSKLRAVCARLENLLTVAAAEV